MMIRFSALVSLAYLFLFASCPVSAVDIPVPSIDEMLLKSDVILLIKMTVKEDEIKGEVKEVIKGDPKIAGQFVNVTSPYPELSFPLKTWVKEAGYDDVLVLGKLNQEANSISLIYGPASFWPRGAPAVLGGKVDIEKCKVFIRAILRTH